MVYTADWSEKLIKIVWEVALAILMHKAYSIKVNNVRELKKIECLEKRSQVCARKSEKVIMRIAFFCNITKGRTLDLYVLPQIKTPYIRKGNIIE